MRLLEKAVLYFTKIQFGGWNDGRVVNEQAGKPLEVKDKYVKNVLKVTF